ncbi:MAG: hypothetical protein ACLFNZ_10320 [Spirochaetaceae bacterium]
MKIFFRVWTVLLFFVLTTPLYAYVGPGLGTGALAVIVGVIVSIFLAIFAIVWYPLKRLLGLGKNKKQAEEPQSRDAAGGSEGEERQE